MVHEGVGFFETPGEKFRQDHDANDHTDRDGDDHAEIQCFDTGSHGLVKAPR